MIRQKSVVVINGFTMPKTCSDCDYELSDDYNLNFECPLLYKGYTTKIRKEKRLDECPLREVEVPLDESN